MRFGLYREIRLHGDAPGGRGGVQGPRSPLTLANDASLAGQAWSNVTNAESSNDSYAAVSLTSQNSQYLKATNFGFTIPSGATITKIVVEIEKKKS